MKFDDLDRRMRVFETGHDHCVLPGIFIVVRLDGRSFTRLTKVTHAFEVPLDERFRDMMLATIEHLMQCGFDLLYGYSESDEISLLLHRDCTSFGRKKRKLESILAGEESAKMSLLLGDIAVFDARACQLPREGDVVDYFRWRQEDAHRNSLSAHCYWMLRREGLDEREATARLHGASVAEMNELLFSRGVNYDTLPAWQKRGIGCYWESVYVAATNALTGAPVTSTRRQPRRVLDLPMKDAYDEFILARIAEGAPVGHWSGFNRTAVRK